MGCDLGRVPVQWPQSALHADKELSKQFARSGRLQVCESGVCGNDLRLAKRTPASYASIGETPYNARYGHGRVEMQAGSDPQLRLEAALYLHHSWRPEGQEIHVRALQVLLLS